MPVPREPDSPVGFHTGADVVGRLFYSFLDERVLGGLALGDLGSIYVTGLVGHVLVAEVHCFHVAGENALQVFLIEECQKNLVVLQEIQMDMARRL